MRSYLSVSEMLAYELKMSVFNVLLSQLSCSYCQADGIFFEFLIERQEEEEEKDAYSIT